MYVYYMYGSHSGFGILYVYNTYESTKRLKFQGNLAVEFMEGLCVVTIIDGS